MELPSGQLKGHEEREPISPATPEGSVRTVTVRLSPSGAQQRKLRKLADASARLYNEVNC
ncbi:hypothetical protein GWK48_07010 [Metallosphaera tengchongensis]|uniref:Transposase n=1 Tax=Metallosphaera tengchongensis TaxID=1532350 RepID=A0A6N0NTQ4_9CREN|nr:hypothetical protein [Metallosphaera tengchongensis]QKR00156.1 hypothetical protein GWK48_07010 [Metallosphaera tengchongensis]